MTAHCDTIQSVRYENRIDFNRKDPVILTIVQNILSKMDIMFAAVFSLELVLKVFALGPWVYLGSAWNWLDAAVVGVTITGW